MDFTIGKLTYADGLAYRYFVRDEDGELQYIADRSGMLLPSPTRLVEFFDPERSLVARLQPPDLLPWQRATRYEIIIGEEVEPHAVIFVKWRLVDLILLRLPRYTLELGTHRYAARAARYGKRLCHVFPAPEEEPEDEEEEDEEAGGEENGGEPEGEREQEEKAEEVEVLPLEELVAADNESDGEAETPEPATLATVERAATGAGYVIAVEEEGDEGAPLREDLFALASLAILIDMELYS
ncbi:MAG: hypothetical protein E3J64_08635 [Anaerolineales bacterium]|nr:MAG: hypothetical protein E3J64_08635 [Anaerolineales bacterium]